MKVKSKLAFRLRGLVGKELPKNYAAWGVMGKLGREHEKREVYGRLSLLLYQGEPRKISYIVIRDRHGQESSVQIKAESASKQ